ncbi:MAG: calcium-translocating P-type ATPase, PMCA-type [Ignavibacteriaceae bacterium]|jgi:Ca2+-transporting ATPase
MKKEEKNSKLYEGLTASQVIIQREIFGDNLISPPVKTPWWKLFLEKFEDPIIRILIIAALVATGIGLVDGNYIEGIGIIVAILLATTLSFLNEFKANKEFDLLNKVTDDEPVKVIRDENYTTIPKKDLVVGDIVLIETGEELPADGTVVEAISLQVNESSLTGESVAVTKLSTDQLATASLKEKAYPADKVLRGTFVVDGHAVIEITAVGDSTEIGKTAKASTEETGQKTPLNLQLEKLSKIIGVFGFSTAGVTFVALTIRDVLIGELNLTGQQWYVIGILGVAVLAALNRVWMPIFFDALDLMGKQKRRPDSLSKNSLFSWFKGSLYGLIFSVVFIIPAIFLKFISPYPWDWLNAHITEEFLKFFMIAITMIVVAVPEGLAMSVTLSLAYSVRKMTATNNLVRKMHAVETISAATVICSDKTGTLTMNEMRAYNVHFPTLKTNKLNSEQLTDIEKIIVESFCGNSTANLEIKESVARVLGNPTEGAMLLWLHENKIDYKKWRSNFEIIKQWTFTTERKFMATYGQSDLRPKPVLLVKGAPEIVLNLCTKYIGEEKVEDFTNQKEGILSELREYQNRAMRTLAFATLEDCEYSEGMELEKIANNMTWLGFIAINDPVREEVPDAVKACLDAGINLKIVTGDTPGTAKEIARKIGLWDNNVDTDEKNLMLGPDFGNLSDEEAAERILDVKILSRARPLDKLRLVKLLQKKDQIVAVTGDGTNDAPALNYANVGLSMGKTGTAVAKQASDIILLDDSFTSIVNAVMWGRSLYQNIQRFLLFQLTINLLALAIVLLGPFIGVQLTLTVPQMIWVNLIMDTFAALALATQPPSKTVMKHKPRKPSDFIITKPMFKSILLSASAFIVLLLTTIFWMQSDGKITDYELSMFFTLFVLLQFWNLFNAKTLGTNNSTFHKFMSNKTFLVINGFILVMQIIIVEFGGKLFRVVPLSFTDWVLIIAGSSIVLWVGEFSRLLKRMRASKQVETV